MKKFKVEKIEKQIIVKFSNKTVALPKKVQSKIDAYWNQLIAEGKGYKRGEVFTVTNKDVEDDRINILVEKTDYAHYLYCTDVEFLGVDNIHTIHTSVLVESSDGYIIFGVMGKQTSRAGIIQLCGGGIDNDDLRGNVFDFDHNISRELKEELDIDVFDSNRVVNFKKEYFKDGGPTDKMAVIYKIVLSDTRDEFLSKYKQFERKLEEPEFEKLVTIKKDKNSIAKFLAQKNVVFDESLEALFKKMMNE